MPLPRQSWSPSLPAHAGLFCKGLIMASLVLSGDTSGSITVAAPAVAGSTTQTLVNVSGTLAPIVSGTAVTASGTSVNFTDIPSWVKRITVMFSGVSTNGSSIPIVQIGDSGGVETSGYIGAITLFAVSTLATENINAAGFNISNSSHASGSVYNGNLIICLQDSSANKWTANGNFGQSDTTRQTLVGGTKSLSATLDRVRITTVNGTDTFDAGTINILYE